MIAKNNKQRSRVLRRASGALLVACAWCAPAIAEDADAFHPFVGVAYTYDDNLLRLPDDYPIEQRDDRMLQGIAGILFDRTYSRQQLYAQAKVTKVKFDHFKQLDYDGKDALARWKWQLTDAFSGSLEGAYVQTLAPYTDFHSDERNLRTQHRTHADIAWLVHPSWRLRAAAGRDRFEYELAVQRYNNRTEKLAEAGIDFVSHSGNYIGLVARRLEGDFPNKRVVGTTVIDENFEQDELKARVNWRGSGITTLDVLAGYAKRKRAYLGERDASGANGRITVGYLPSGKTKFTVAVYREFTPTEGSIVSYSLNKGASLGVVYVATGKTSLNGSYSREQRNYVTRVALPQGMDLSDTLTNAQLGVTYEATRNIQLSLSGFSQRRTSGDFGLGSFRARGATFSANVQF